MPEAYDAEIALLVTKEVREEIALLAKYAEYLEKIVSAAESAGPQPGTSAVAKNISGHVGLPTNLVQRLISCFLNVYHTQRRISKDSETVVKAIAENLNRDTATKGDSGLREAWERAGQTVANALSKLGPDHPLVVSHKALGVVYAHQHILTEAKIYTDIRPVFNSRGDEVVQMIITHVLSIEYHDEIKDHRRIQLALDASDVADLKRACTRAEDKAKAAKNALDGMSWPTSIFNDPPTAECPRE